MIGTQLALIRREIWEHKSLYVVPGVLSLVIVLMSVLSQVFVSRFESQIDMALFGASNLGEAERAAALTAGLFALTTTFIMAMGILTIFYALDSLYAERKDKSILFWRSLPVTDTETVLSKLATAILVIPAFTLAAVAVTHILVFLVSSIWIEMRGASAWTLLWQPAPFFDTWLATFIILVALAIWISPFIGWFLFVSTFAKRSPFLFAFLPLIVIPMVEGIVFRTNVFFTMLTERIPFNAPIIAELNAGTFDFEEESVFELAQEGISVLSLLDLGRFLMSPAVWLGVIVCGLFCFGAIYVRRYRDES